MPKEQLNSVIMAGPISKFKIGKAMDFGTNLSFLVGGVSDVPIRVSMLSKFQRQIEAGQSAKSVVITNGFMDCWTSKPDGKDNFQVSARPAGVFFLESMVEPYCSVQVEGEIVAANGQWGLLHSSYKVPGKEGAEAHEKSRKVNVALSLPMDPSMVGCNVLVTGRLVPKVNDTWFLHVFAEHLYVLYRS